MSAQKSIILIGMAYSGKSTIGPLLSRQLLLEYVDTDHLIQAREGASLQSLIDTRGVAAFRQLEQAHVSTLDAPRHVIATGGSVVYSTSAMRHLQESGQIVWLDVPLQQLTARATDQGTRGLVIAPGMTFADLYHERYPLYKEWADIRVEAGDKSPAAIVAQIVEILYQRKDLS